MKKIITAINNPKINEEINKNPNIETISKDVQYREAILELLEQFKNTDIIILYEKILGKITIEELIIKIQKINPKIKIIIFLEKKDNNKIKMLLKRNVKNIYFKKDLKYKKIINIINNNLLENKIKNNKIKNNKKLINEKIKNKINNNKLNNKKINNKIINNKLINKINNYKLINNNKNKIITIIGKNNLEKNKIIIFLIEYLKNKKILFINFEKNDQKIKNDFKFFRINFNKNIKFIYNPYLFLEKIQTEKPEKIFEKIKQKFDFIIIKDSYIFDKEIKHNIIENTDTFVWTVSLKDLGIKEISQMKRFSQKYLQNIKSSLHIIAKNIFLKDINPSLLKKTLSEKKNIYLSSFEYEYINYKKNLKKNKRKIKINMITKIKLEKIINL